MANKSHSAFCRDWRPEHRGCYRSSWLGFTPHHLLFVRILLGSLLGTCKGAVRTQTQTGACFSPRALVGPLSTAVGHTVKEKKVYYP